MTELDKKSTELKVVLAHEIEEHKRLTSLIKSKMETLKIAEEQALEAKRLQDAAKISAASVKKEIEAEQKEKQEERANQKRAQFGEILEVRASSQYLDKLHYAQERNTFERAMSAAVRAAAMAAMERERLASVQDMQQRDHEIPHTDRVKEVMQNKHYLENELQRLQREENDAYLLRDIQHATEEARLAEAVQKNDDAERMRIAAQAIVINRHLEAWLAAEMESIRRRRAVLAEEYENIHQEHQRLRDSAEAETNVLERKNKENLWLGQEALAKMLAVDADAERKAKLEASETARKAEAARGALKAAKAAAVAAAEESRSERLQAEAAEAEKELNTIKQLQKIQSLHAMPPQPATSVPVKLESEKRLAEEKKGKHQASEDIGKTKETRVETVSAAPLTTVELERRRVIQSNLTELLHAETINFKPNTTKIVPESKGALEKIAKILAENPGVLVDVEGHVWVPNSKRNDPTMMRQAAKLSAYRAKSVVKYLRKKGVAKNQLNAEGFGGSRPLPEGEDSKRVEIKVVGLPENDDAMDAATAIIPSANGEVECLVNAGVLEVRFLQPTSAEELQITRQCVVDFNHSLPGKALACPLVVGKRIDGNGSVHGYTFQQPVRIWVPLSHNATRTTPTRESSNITVLHKADDGEDTPWTVLAAETYSILWGKDKQNSNQQQQEEEQQQHCVITVDQLCYFAVLEDVDLSLLSPHVAARAEQDRNDRAVRRQAAMEEEKQALRLEEAERAAALAAESARLAELAAKQAAEDAAEECRKQAAADEERRLQEESEKRRMEESAKQEAARLQLIEIAKTEAEAARKRAEEEQLRREKAAAEAKRLVEAAELADAQRVREEFREREEQERRQKAKEEAERAAALQESLALAAAEEAQRAAEQAMRDEADRIKAEQERRQEEEARARIKIDEERSAAAAAAKEASRALAESDQLQAQEKAAKEEEERRRQLEANEAVRATAAAEQEAIEAATKAKALAAQGFVKEAAAAAEQAKLKEERAKQVFAYSVEVQLRNILLAEKIWFHRGKTWVKNISVATIEKIAKVLSENPSIEKICIEGHVQVDYSRVSQKVRAVRAALLFAEM